MKINEENREVGGRGEGGGGGASLPVGRNSKKPRAFILLLRGKLLQASTCLEVSERKIGGRLVMIIELVSYNLVSNFHLNKTGQIKLQQSLVGP